MDESGDLGFGKGSSKYFIISFLVVNNKRLLDKIVKKILASLKVHVDVLHATRDVPTSVKKLLYLLIGQETSILTICLDKSSVPVVLQQKKHTLYNLVVNSLLEK
jgi:hypothetical protein